MQKILILLNLTNWRNCKKQCNLTREDDYKLAKHFIKINTGLDFIDSDIVKLFRHNDLVYNFACSIDDANIKCKDQIKYNENLMKLNYVRIIINNLGFQNIFDKSLIKMINLKQIRIMLLII